MSLISALANVHHQGQFGDFEDKKGDDLLKISEKKNLLIVQIVQFKNSNIQIESIDIDTEEELDIVKLLISQIEEREKLC